MTKVIELTKTEIDILEEMDALNRAMIRTSLIDFCATSNTGPELVTGADVEVVLRKLLRQGFLEFRFRKWLRVTEKGLTRIKRKHHIHFETQSGKRTNEHGKPCSEKRPCKYCKLKMKTCKVCLAVFPASKECPMCAERNNHPDMKSIHDQPVGALSHRGIS